MQLDLQELEDRLQYKKDMYNKILAEQDALGIQELQTIADMRELEQQILDYHETAKHPDEENWVKDVIDGVDDYIANNP